MLHHCKGLQTDSRGHILSSPPCASWPTWRDVPPMWGTVAGWPPDAEAGKRGWKQLLGSRRCPILLRDELWVEEGMSTVSKSGWGKGERSFGEAAGLGENGEGSSRLLVGAWGFSSLHAREHLSFHTLCVWDMHLWAHISWNLKTIQYLTFILACNRHLLPIHFQWCLLNTLGPPRRRKKI